MHPRVFLIICAVVVVIQGIVVVAVWVRAGEVSYKAPRDPFGAAPHERIRRADTPIWFWCNIAVAVLIHILLIYVLLMAASRMPQLGFAKYYVPFQNWPNTG